MGVGGEGTETFRYQQQQEQQQTEDPDQVVVKQEPEDYYMDSVEEITVGAAYSLNGAAGEETVETCQAEDDDPLDSKPLKLRGRKKKKRNKRRREEKKGAANLTNGIEESPVASTSSSKLDKKRKRLQYSALCRSQEEDQSGSECDSSVHGLLGFVHENLQRFHSVENRNSSQG